jgi:hypothetical protein
VVSNFDKEYVVQRDRAQLDSPHEVSLSNSQEDLFKGFSYCRTPPIAAGRYVRFFCDQSIDRSIVASPAHDSSG